MIWRAPDTSVISQEQIQRLELADTNKNTSESIPENKGLVEADRSQNTSESLSENEGLVEADRSQNTSESLSENEGHDEGDAKENISESLPENEGLCAPSKRPSLHLPDNLSSEETIIIQSIECVANFHQQATEMALRDYARRIKNEANSHCKKIKRIALEEITICKSRPASEVFEEYNQLVTENLQKYGEQLDILLNSTVANMRNIEKYYLTEIEDVLGNASKRDRKTFYKPKDFRSLVSEFQKASGFFYVIVFLFVAFQYSLRFFF